MGGRIYTARRVIIGRGGLGVFPDLDGDSQYFYRTDADFPESGITGATDLTIEAWIAPDNVSHPSNTYGIVTKYDRTGNNRMYAFYMTIGELGLLNSDDGTAFAFRESTNASLVVDQWVHVAVAYDASAGSCIFYQDGSALTDDGNALKTSIADKTPDFRIGSRPDNAGSFFYFDGSIRNVALFDDIRTPTEILASANNRHIDLSGEGNLIGQWKLDDAAAATVMDNLQGDAGRDLIPYDAGDVTFENCGRTTESIW